MVINYLSVSQFSIIHNMKVGRIRLLIADGRISAIKIGSRWAIEDTVQPPEVQKIIT